LFGREPRGNNVRVLVYKRTHNGDPDQDGRFGVYDCMGAVRHRDFDAVIGVGGIGPEAHANGIAGQVNWIGIGPRKTSDSDKRGPVVTFDHFLDFGTDGPDLRVLAPALAERMYSDNVRHLMDGLRKEEHREAIKILGLAQDAPPSPGQAASRGRAGRLSRCVARRRTNRCSRPGPHYGLSRYAVQPAAPAAEL